MRPGGCHKINMIPNVDAVTRVLDPDYDFLLFFEHIFIAVPCHISRTWTDGGRSLRQLTTALLDRPDGWTDLNASSK